MPIKLDNIDTMTVSGHKIHAPKGVGALYLSQQVYDILFVQDNVANFMHIVGGACGTVFGFAVRRK